MKKLLVIFLFVFSFLWYTFALTWDTNCEELKSKFYIVWNDVVKIKTDVTYKVNNYNDSVTWELYKNDKLVHTFFTNELDYNFKSTWDVLLVANFNYDKCDLKLEKKISVYSKFIILIKEKKVSFIPYDQLRKKSIYFKNITIDELENNLYLLQNADYIIIDQDDIIKFFSEFHKLWLIDKKQKFILLINSFKGFYSKFIIPYIKNVYRNNIYVYSDTDFLNILETIYQWQDLDKWKLFVSSSVWDKIYFPLSYFINKLIANWVSIDSIGLVLLALFWIIVIAVFRQIIWFSVFWVYTPLLFVVLMMTIGYKITLLLFVLSILSNIITYFITKKIYILYSSKIALNYIIYVIISIIFIGFLLKYQFIVFSNINNTTLLAFFIMPLLSKNLVKEETNVFSKSFWVFVLEFTIISGILVLIFNFDTLKYILIAYPDLLWLFVIVTILIWKFSGLQLLEYIRFYPLIKKGFYEEE